MRRIVTAAVVLGLWSAACGGEPVTLTAEVTTPDPAPIAFASPAACALDSDCEAGLFCFQGACARECAESKDCASAETCSDRGRCVAALQGLRDATSGAPDIDVDPGVTLTKLPASTQEVPLGADALEVKVQVSAPPASGLLAYRVERTDGMGDPRRVRKAEGTTEFTLTLDSGLANPASETPGPVSVYVVTSAGAFTLTLIPQLPFAGQYAGEATLAQFGQTGLPIDFYVVTDPADASLRDADQAWVVMPVGPAKLFSPHPRTLPEGQEETMTRELVWQGAPVNRWVAVFVSEYGLGPDSVVVAGRRPGQVRRTIRLEIEPYGPRGLIGRISDRWTGLYDARSDLGPRVPANVVYEGELDMERVGPAPGPMEIMPPETVEEGSPAVLPLPSLDACAGLSFDVPASDAYDCAGVTSAADFEVAGSAAQAACAIAVSRDALAGETTAKEIASFLDDTNTSGESFADFMQRCAAGTDGTCRPSDEVLCGRQLAAYAYAGLTQDLDSTADLVTAFQDASREAFLGQQMGAFETDAQTRLEWLKTSDYPAIVTSAVKDLIDRLLREWAANVLDVHLGVLAGQFDGSGLAVLSQPATGPDAAGARKTLLLEMSQSWRGAADALTLAAARWNQLYQDDATRAEKADFVSRRLFDLYLVAGMLTDFNRASGASFASGTFAAGFAQVMRDLGQLMLPFDQLVYARDAEVVVSTSVDPSSDNSTLLRERREAAQAEIASASEAVGAIIEEAQAEALNQAELTHRMNNEINDVRSGLVELCGLPVGCTADSFRTDPTCDVRTGPGECGFLIDHETEDYLDFEAGQQSVSEAGSKLLAVRDAALSFDRALEELRAHDARASLFLGATEAFAAQVDRANAQRLDLIDQLRDAMASRQGERDDAVAALLDNIAARNATRREAITSTAAEIAKWNMMRVNGITTTFAELQAVSALRSSAEGMFQGAELAEGWSEAIAAGLPTSTGTSNDVTSGQRMAALVIGLVASTGLRVAGVAMDAAANAKEVNAQKQQALADAELQALQDQSDLSDAVTAADLAAFEEEAEAAAAKNRADEAAYQELLTLLEKQAEAELAFQRDLGELNDRRTQYKQMLVGGAGLEVQVAQARLGMDIALQEYLRVAQRAQLQGAHLRDLERQRDEINSLVGSPAAVFAWANRLQQAERRLQRAKDKLYDWLVALEYLAVRPFMDQRVQILLARNTYQLEAIADEIERLQGKCGGPTSHQVSELSLRDDLLGLGLVMEDTVTGEVQTPAERLRALLERGYVPIDKRVRYTSDSSIGGLLASRSVLAASFTVSLGDFANLAAACNAKVWSIAVELVGDGLGTGQPTISVLYDGSSELRSCQPGLETYLDAIGRESTSFGAITRLHAPGRSVSPVAGLNAFPESSGNVSLQGLPLASQYTILIDPQLGENSKVDWSRLEDVRIRLDYTYQDLFPAGQCE